MSKNTTESKFDVQQCSVVQKYRHETLGRRERKQTGSDSIQDANCCPIRCDTMIQRERKRQRQRERLVVVSLDCLTVCFANGNDLNSLGQNSSTRHGELRHQHSRSACLTVDSSLSISLYKPDIPPECNAYHTKGRRICAIHKKEKENSMKCTSESSQLAGPEAMQIQVFDTRFICEIQT